MCFCSFSPAVAAGGGHGREGGHVTRWSTGERLRHSDGGSCTGVTCHTWHITHCTSTIPSYYVLHLISLTYVCMTCSTNKTVLKSEPIR